MKQVCSYLWKGLFVIYILILLKAVVFKLPADIMRMLVDSWDETVVRNGMAGANYTPFRTIDMYIRYWDWGSLRSFENLIGNVIAFMPFGIFLPSIWKSCRNVFICAGYGLTFVLGIELFQMFSGFGVFDVDDIILNCAGIMIGYVLYLLWDLFRKRCTKIGKTV